MDSDWHPPMALPAPSPALPPTPLSTPQTRGVSPPYVFLGYDIPYLDDQGNPFYIEDEYSRPERCEPGIRTVPKTHPDAQRIVKHTQLQTKDVGSDDTNEWGCVAHRHFDRIGLLLRYGANETPRKCLI